MTDGACVLSKSSGPLFSRTWRERKFWRESKKKKKKKLTFPAGNLLHRERRERRERRREKREKKKRRREEKATPWRGILKVGIGIGISIDTERERGEREGEETVVEKKVTVMADEAKSVRGDATRRAEAAAAEEGARKGRRKRASG